MTPECEGIHERHIQNGLFTGREPGHSDSQAQRTRISRQKFLMQCGFVLDVAALQITWGDSDCGGDSSQVRHGFNGINVGVCVVVCGNCIKCICLLFYHNVFKLLV